jgi:hypothetical protein
MAASEKIHDAAPLVERVDALLRRQEDAGRSDADIPVLTEVIDDTVRPVRPGLDATALEILARELERAVLARLGPEIDRVIEEKLARTLSEVLGQALDGVRAELTGSVTQMVREAVAASVDQALGEADRK